MNDLRERAIQGLIEFVFETCEGSGLAVFEELLNAGLKKHLFPTEIKPVMEFISESLDYYDPSHPEGSSWVDTIMGREHAGFISENELRHKAKDLLDKLEKGDSTIRARIEEAIGQKKMESLRKEFMKWTVASDGSLRAGSEDGNNYTILVNSAGKGSDFALLCNGNLLAEFNDWPERWSCDE